MNKCLFCGSDLVLSIPQRILGINYIGYGTCPNHNADNYGKTKLFFQMEYVYAIPDKTSDKELFSMCFVYKDNVIHIQYYTLVAVPQYTLYAKMPEKTRYDSIKFNINDALSTHNCSIQNIDWDLTDIDKMINSIKTYVAFL